MDLYREKILDHYQNPRNFGDLSNPDVSVKLNNPLCGDEIEIFVKLKENKLSEVKFKGKGCVISQATASMLTEAVKGRSTDEILNYDKNFVLELLGIELGPNRLKCALLSFEALQNAVQKLKVKS